MYNIAVIVSGSGTNLQALIDAQKAGILKGGKVSLVIADKDDSYALMRAHENGVPYATVVRRNASNFEALVLNLLSTHSIDIVVCAGFLGIFSADFIGHFPQRIVNIHPSLIPKFCGKGFYGMKVHEAVLAAGEKVSGATVHYVNEGVDEGEIIIQTEVPVLEGDSPQTLQQRVLKAEWEILPQAIQKVIERMKKAEGTLI